MMTPNVKCCLCRWINLPQWLSWRAITLQLVWQCQRRPQPRLRCPHLDMGQTHGAHHQKTAIPPRLALVSHSLLVATYWKSPYKTPSSSCYASADSTQLHVSFFNSSFSSHYFLNSTGSYVTSSQFLVFILPIYTRVSTILLLELRCWYEQILDSSRIMSELDFSSRKWRLKKRLSYFSRSSLAQIRTFWFLEQITIHSFREINHIHTL